MKETNKLYLPYILELKRIAHEYKSGTQTRQYTDSTDRD